ncbi:hypothetical protein [Kitasatospora sp. NPDC056731]|uniref:hypothetical protein n=1 Tax=Kitasatospora sp. NPDC056731 TaxID=3155422 RepID=UPI00342B357A
MLRTVEITAELTVPLRGEVFHNLHWQKKLDLSLDCFTCERTGRTTHFRYGEECAVCSGSQRAEHPAAARVAAFDITDERERTVLRAVVDYWWAPFHDIKRDQPATTRTRAPWVRLYLGYRCPESQQAEAFSIQSNMVRPVSQACTRCAHPLATSAQSPNIRLMS